MYCHQQSSQAPPHTAIKLHRSRQLYPPQKLNQPAAFTNMQDVWLCLFDRTSDARNVTHACDRRGKKTWHVCPNEGARESSNCDRRYSDVLSLGYELDDTFLLSIADTRLQTSRLHIHRLPIPKSIFSYFKLQCYSSTLIQNKATKPVPEPTEPPTQ
jgi:hypothetical protein